MHRFRTNGGKNQGDNWLTKAMQGMTVIALFVAQFNISIFALFQPREEKAIRLSLR